MRRFEPLLLPIFACLTLGLSPFVPQPHVVEKLRWLWSGHPFAPIDVFDLALHGLPWVWLIYAVVRWWRPPPGPPR